LFEEKSNARREGVVVKATVLQIHLGWSSHSKPISNREKLLTRGSGVSEASVDSFRTKGNALLEEKYGSKHEEKAYFQKATFLSPP
jgi:hypothetical protein